MLIREMKPSEYGELENFLYEAIYIPEGVQKPPREILTRPELKIYVDDFGARAGDCCIVAEVDGKLVGACWARIMNDYEHLDDETPSLALSVKKIFGVKALLRLCLRKFLRGLPKKISVECRCRCRKKITRRLNFIGRQNLKSSLNAAKNC